MKHYVITIMDNEKSVEAATRCISSAHRAAGINVEMFHAVTPAIDLEQKAKELGILLDGFREKYSRFENCAAAFMSHMSLWKQSALTGEEITIFEHDAYVEGQIPDFITYRGCVNLGKPSYGKFNTPQSIGVGPLVSKPYFPGAHAYRINPQGAEELMREAMFSAAPTDVFLHRNKFPWLEEYYPWPVVAKDSFTTIQHKVGCLAKHNYNEDYEIV